MLSHVRRQLTIGCLEKYGDGRDEYLPVVLSLKYMFTWAKKVCKTI